MTRITFLSESHSRHNCIGTPTKAGQGPNLLPTPLGGVMNARAYQDLLFQEAQSPSAHQVCINKEVARLYPDQAESELVSQSREDLFRVWNANVRNSKEENIIQMYSLGNRNEARKHFIIITVFQQLKQCLYAWTSQMGYTKIGLIILLVKKIKNLNYNSKDVVTDCPWNNSQSAHV